MPAKAKAKPADPAPEADPEPEVEEKPAEDPTAKLLKQLADQNSALQKRLELMEKRLPKPSDEEAVKIQKAKEEEEHAVKLKAEDDAMLADYKEMLASKFGFTEGIETLAEARTLMKAAKANKLDLQSLSEKMKGGNAKTGEESNPKPAGKSYFDTTRLKEAIKDGS
jgi:hypothetical protein